MAGARFTNEKLVVSSTYVATTFRFVPEATAPRAAK